MTAMDSSGEMFTGGGADPFRTLLGTLPPVVLRAVALDLAIAKGQTGQRLTGVGDGSGERKWGARSNKR